jgi:hypothetical protein
LALGLSTGRRFRSIRPLQQVTFPQGFDVVERDRTPV